MLPKAKALFLKPCCLPGIFYQKRQEFFEVGNYQFPTKDVCASGKWKSSKKVKGRWKGPPRWHLEGKFHKWCYHLEQGIQSTPSDSKTASNDKEEALENDDNKTAIVKEEKEDGNEAIARTMKTQLIKIPVQTKGGYQNSFLFAEKGPALSDIMWDDLGQRKKELDALQHQREEETKTQNDESPATKKLKESEPVTDQPKTS